MTSSLAYEPLILRNAEAPVKLHNKSQEKFLLTGANTAAKPGWVPHPTDRPIQDKALKSPQSVRHSPSLTMKLTQTLKHGSISLARAHGHVNHPSCVKGSWQIYMDQCNTSSPSITKSTLLTQLLRALYYNTAPKTNCLVLKRSKSLSVTRVACYSFNPCHKK